MWCCVCLDPSQTYLVVGVQLVKTGRRAKPRQPQHLRGQLPGYPRKEGLREPLRQGQMEEAGPVGGRQPRPGPGFRPRGWRRRR